MSSMFDNFQDKNNYGQGVENKHEFVEENSFPSSPYSRAFKNIYLDVQTGAIEENPLVPSASLEILQNYTRGLKRLSGATFDLKPKPQHRLSTEDILRLAGERFILNSSPKSSYALLSCKNFIDLSLSEFKDVDIIYKLLCAAEKAGQKKYDHARMFLDICDSSSSEDGNQMERLVNYFSKALREKVDRETGRVYSRDSLKKQSKTIIEKEMRGSPSNLVIHQALSISQTGLYAGTQAIVERVAGSRRVHVIDLGIYSGLHHSVLMQALADRVESPIELLKITAISAKLKSITEDTGERLKSFAKSVNLPFQFNIVTIPDFMELDKDLFNLERDETVVVSAFYALRTMLGKQDELESLMRVVKSINPSVMVVAEIEGKHNSPVFVNRFIEALFYFGAYFDYVEECMGHDWASRKQTESIHMYYGIRNLIVAEGDERTYRHVSLDIWRRFFARFGMREEEMSMSSFIQASMVMKNYACWKSCTIEKDGKSLLFGWKGMPLKNVSAWSFKLSDGEP